jgi:hypothetical protein
MDIIRLYQDFSIPYATEGHKHCRPGWVNIECPLCTGEHPGLHLGFNLQTNHYVCWRCGWKPVSKVISTLLHMPENAVRSIILQYGGIAVRRTTEPTVKIRLKAHRLPSNTIPLQANHKRYLEKRGFDPDRLEREWQLVGTGPVSTLDNINFKHRIIAPIIWDGVEVSFQGRDITNKSQLKYITCPKDRELMFHKNILYGKQESWGKTIIIVEGITDVWRFGQDAACTFGIKFTSTQIKKIAGTFTRAAICFDGGERQAYQQANRLVAELKFRGVDSFRVDILGDPGGMPQSDADYLVKQLINK